MQCCRGFVEGRVKFLFPSPHFFCWRKIVPSNMVLASACFQVFCRKFGAFCGGWWLGSPIFPCCLTPTNRKRRVLFEDSLNLGLTNSPLKSIPQVVSQRALAEQYDVQRELRLRHAVPWNSEKLEKDFFGRRRHWWGVKLIYCNLYIYIYTHILFKDSNILFIIKFWDFVCQQQSRL